MSKTIISEVTISPVKPRNGLVALASCVIDGKIYVGSIGVYTKLKTEGYRLTYPNKKVGESAINIFHPISKDLTDAIEEAIFSKYEELVVGIVADYDTE